MLVNVAGMGVSESRMKDLSSLKQESFLKTEKLTKIKTKKVLSQS